MAASEARPVKRGRTARLNHYVGPPAHVLVGARISVFWPDDDAFYKARYRCLSAIMYCLLAQTYCQRFPERRPLATRSC